MTKRQARQQRRADWQESIARRLVIRFNDGETFTAYPTIEARDRALADATAAGIHAVIVGENPMEAFAASLNPPAGALADALPFTLTPPPAAPEPDGTEQPDLFTEPKA